MSNSRKTSLNVANLAAPIVGSMDVVSALRAAIAKTRTKSVDLDFKNVEFVSRSAAHEILSMKRDLERMILKKKDVAFINMHDEVRNMFRVVAANIAVPIIIKPTIHMKSVSIDSLINGDEERVRA